MAHYVAAGLTALSTSIQRPIASVGWPRIHSNRVSAIPFDDLPKWIKVGKSSDVTRGAAEQGSGPICAKHPVVSSEKLDPSTRPMFHSEAVKNSWNRLPAVTNLPHSQIGPLSGASTTAFE